MPRLNHKTEACFSVQLGECNVNGLSTPVTYQDIEGQYFTGKILAFLQEMTPEWLAIHNLK